VHMTMPSHLLSWGLQHFIPRLVLNCPILLDCHLPSS
jgi:hypothetical protein